MDVWPHIEAAKKHAKRGDWLASIAESMLALAISDAIIHDPASTVEAVTRADQTLGHLPHRPVPSPVDFLRPRNRARRGQPDVPQPDVPDAQ
jgi:hypothetical protein